MSEHLKPILKSMAPLFGYTADCRFPFRFPEIKATRTTTYNPDCVWFLGKPTEENTCAIFEVDKDPSRKHRVGGAALANVAALKLMKPLHYFAIVPPMKEQIASSCIELLRMYLGDKWYLQAIVIPSFDSKCIEEQIRHALSHPLGSLK